MRVFVTGDCHADFNKFDSKHFKDGKTLTSDDVVIVCGDFGGIWAKSEREKYWLDWLARKKFTICFCDGNHENFDRLNSEFKVVDFHGGKAHKIRHNIYHLMRGEIFDFGDKKYFVFGGAKSHDIQDGILDRNDYATETEFENTVRLYYWLGKMYRIRGISWWDAELPTQDELDYAESNLNKYDYKVDYVISHCCPSSISQLMIRHTDNDILTDWFESIKDKLEFSHWYFGHYHYDKDIDDKYTVLYHTIREIGENNE